MNTATAENKVMYISQAENFSKIPGSPIAYWVSQALFNIFDNCGVLENKTVCAAGVSSGDNDKYLKLWYEVPSTDISFNSKTNDDFHFSRYKFAPCNKGGSFRKWYGNNEYVAYWAKADEFHRNGSTYSELLFKAGMSWSAISTYKFNGRYYPVGYLFDHASPSLFAKNKEQLMSFIALANSNVGQLLLTIINPTINTGADSLRKIPVSEEMLNNIQVEEITEHCIKISKADWDSFEPSWDFKKHPLI